MLKGSLDSGGGGGLLALHVCLKNKFEQDTRINLKVLKGSLDSGVGVTCMFP